MENDEKASIRICYKILGWRSPLQLLVIRKKCLTWQFNDYDPTSSTGGITSIVVSNLKCYRKFFATRKIESV